MSHYIPSVESSKLKGDFGWCVIVGRGEGVDCVPEEEMGDTVGPEASGEEA